MLMLRSVVNCQFVLRQLRMALVKTNPIHFTMGFFLRKKYRTWIHGCFVQLRYCYVSTLVYLYADFNCHGSAKERPLSKEKEKLRLMIFFCPLLVIVKYLYEPSGPSDRFLSRFLKHEMTRSISF